VSALRAIDLFALGFACQRDVLTDLPWQLQGSLTPALVHVWHLGLSDGHVRLTLRGEVSICTHTQAPFIVLNFASQVYLIVGNRIYWISNNPFWEACVYHDVQRQELTNQISPPTNCRVTRATTMARCGKRVYLSARCPLSKFQTTE